MKTTGIGDASRNVEQTEATPGSKEEFLQKGKSTAKFLIGGLILAFGSGIMLAGARNFWYAIPFAIGIALVLVGSKKGNSAAKGYRQFYLFPAMDAAFGAGNVVYGGEEKLSKASIWETGLFTEKPHMEGEIQLSFTYKGIPTKVYDLHTYHIETRRVKEQDEDGNDHTVTKQYHATHFSGVGFVLQTKVAAPLRMLVVQKRFLDDSGLGGDELKPVYVGHEERFRNFVLYCKDNAADQRALIEYLTAERLQILSTLQNQLPEQRIAFEWNENRLFAALQGETLNVMKDPPIIIGQGLDEHYSEASQRIVQNTHIPMQILQQFLEK